MPRISKAPEIRRQEIIDTAMGLFARKGYDETSIADIAKAMNVVPGLIYRYFASKQELFSVAVAQYAEESARPFVAILLQQEVPFTEKLQRMMKQMAQTENHSRYSEFYHQPENQTFHVQLAMEMCTYMTPHLTKEIVRLCDAGVLTEAEPRALVEFILYGMVSLWAATPGDHQPFEQRVANMSRYVEKLLGTN